MDRYQKVENPKVETSIDENEIRITSQGRMRSYITYAMTLLQCVEISHIMDNLSVTTDRLTVERLVNNFCKEKDRDEIVFKAMGRAINKTVTMVELVKRRIVDLHQITAIQSIDITDTWEPLEEGLQTLQTTRKVSMITITLSKKELDQTNLGYQPPIPADQVKVYTEFNYDGEGSPSGRGRGRGRFGRGRGRSRVAGNGFASVEYEDEGYERNHSYTRGAGRGRGLNFRDRFRGGYNNPSMEPQNDAEGYNQEAPRDQGRGRGRGRGRGSRGRGRGFGSNGPVHAVAGGD